MKNLLAARMANKNRKGFTLVEIVVVILIIAILTGAVFLGGATVVKQSREAKVKTDLRNMATYVQDMMYDNPELQYNSGEYKYNESFTYDGKTSKYQQINSAGTFDTTAGGVTVGTPETAADSLTVATDSDNVNMKVLNLLNTKYLTADFQLDGSTVDAWKNPYCFSFDMSPSVKTGDPASCIIVINSLGANSIDETSDASAYNTTTGIKVANKAIATLGDTNNSSATEVVANCDLDKKGDDYGVVICMIDGQVSTAYYGF